MVGMLLGLPGLSFLVVVAQKLPPKEKLISLRAFLNAVLGSKEFLYYVMYFSITVLAILKLCVAITHTFIYPELRLLKKCY